MKAELDEIKQFHSTSVSQRALWFVAATPTVNQVYISESMLSKGVQLLFKTATFYLIFIPGLSLLFPACHIATHLHKSFWKEGLKKRGGGGEVAEGKAPRRGPSAISPPQLFEKQEEQQQPGDDDGHRQNNTGIHRAGGGAPFLMHCLPAALSLSG